MVRSRLGGRWAVSWQGYLLLFPISVPLGLLVVPALSTSSTWLLGLAVAVVAYAVTGLILWLASATVLRLRAVDPAPVWLVVVVGGLAWASRSAVFALAIQRAGLPSDTSAVQRLIVGFLLGALLVPGIAWVLATLNDFQRERERLLSDLVRRELAAEGSATYLQVMREDLLDRVSTRMHQEAAPHEGEGDPSGDAPGAAMERQLADLERAVRKISHELADSTWGQARAKTRITVTMISVAVSRRPFTLWPLLPYLVVCYLFVARLMPPSAALVVALAAVAWAAAVALLGEAVGRRWAGPSGLRFGVFVLLLLLSGPVAEIGHLVTGASTSMGANLVIAVSASVTVVMVAGGLAHALNVSEAAVLADLEASISDAEVRAGARAREEARLQREIAIHLHGTVAANVTAATMRLRQAIDEGDVLIAKAAYAEACQLLDSDLRTTMLAEQSDLSALIRELAESWDGIADVRATITGEQGLPPSTVRDIVSVITEAVSNAVRHARATRVDVLVAVSSTVIDIEVVDDGNATGAAGRGLGSSLFDHVSPGDWERSANPSGGTSVRLHVRR